MLSSFFFFMTRAPTDITPLSLPDALPICPQSNPGDEIVCLGRLGDVDGYLLAKSEEHTSELQSLAYLVCRLLLEKKKQQTSTMLAYCIPPVVRFLHA